MGFLLLTNISDRKTMMNAGKGQSYVSSTLCAQNFSLLASILSHFTFIPFLGTWNPVSSLYCKEETTLWWQRFQRKALTDLFTVSKVFITAWQEAWRHAGRHGDVSKSSTSKSIDSRKKYTLGLAWVFVTLFLQQGHSRHSKATHLNLFK